MRYPNEFIDRLRNHLPLSEVIGRRIVLKRHGREFHALCPFHKEKSPSFTVNDDKGFFHCFGCAAHGDSIGFIKDYEGISYPEAIERLANEAGLPLPAMTREAQAEERKRHSLEDVVALAGKWYSEQLHAASGKEAQIYLKERGVSPEIQAQFMLGFAPNHRDALKQALMKQGISEAMLIETGLLAKADDGTSYDRFRGRLIFPIKNTRGVMIAFGGRILPSAMTANTAKYLNSPETPLFKKGDNLFAYDLAKQHVREQGGMILVEGYMDVIMLHQAGFTTAVAPLGTAVTESQLGLLWRAHPEPIMCLDGDSAGQRAMQRAVDTSLPTLKPGFSLACATLPKGDDPDSLIRTSGRLALEQVLAQARPLSLVIWEQSVEHVGTQTPEKRAMLEQHLNQMMTRIADPVVRQHFKEEFRQRIFAISAKKKSGKSIENTSALATLAAETDIQSHLKAIEEQLVRIVLLHPALLNQADIEDYLGQMDFTQASLDKLRSHALEINASVQIVDAASFHSQLSGLGHSEIVGYLLDAKHATLPEATRADILHDPIAARTAWNKTLSEYTMKKHECELLDAEHALGQEASQANLDRFLELQRLVTKLRQHHYAMTSNEQIS